MKAAVAAPRADSEDLQAGPLDDARLHGLNTSDDVRMATCRLARPVCEGVCIQTHTHMFLYVRTYLVTYVYKCIYTYMCMCT